MGIATDWAGLPTPWAGLHDYVPDRPYRPSAKVAPVGCQLSPEIIVMVIAGLKAIN